MKILVVGSGGREHALAWKLSLSPRVTRLYCVPGNAGTAQIAENVALAADDIENLCRFAATNQVDLTVVGPEAPLVAGIADRFRQAGLPIVGPSRQAARLEGSKAFSKDFLQRNGVPTAAYQIFEQPDSAEQALRSGRFEFPMVLKADGLAAGKGVFICRELQESLRAVNTIMREREFGKAGDRLIVEEYLQGEEASFMVFTDGTEVLSMAASQDHKAIYDGDQGPNTGGMGAYSIDAILSDTLRQQILDQIIYPTIRGMSREGNPYQGVLYAGLMLTREGPKVLEFNVRFGDPETQVVLPRLESDLAEVLLTLARGKLQGITLQWNRGAAVCVVLAARGYPGSYEKGKEITGLEMATEVEGTLVFHAGTARQDGKIVTSGGRVLGVTSQGRSLDEAIIQAYEGINKIHFEGMYYRRDIAARGLRRLTTENREETKTG